MYIMFIFLCLAISWGSCLAQTQQGCLEELLENVTIDYGYQDVAVDLTQPFTLFVPSESAAASFASTYSLELCDVPGLGELATASIIPGDLTKAKLSSESQSSAVDLPSGSVKYEIYKTNNLVHVIVMDADGDIVDELKATSERQTKICSGNGVIHTLGGVITPPGVQEQLDTFLDEGGCGSSEPALQVGADIGLEDGGATAAIPISVGLDAVAVDSNGNDVPLNSELELLVEATLEEIERARSSDVTVTVPVAVNVIVQGSDTCDLDGATINVPVDVEVAVSVVVDGRPIGTGKQGVVYNKCDSDVADLYDPCGGITLNETNMKYESYTKQCSEGVCLKKNKWFAQCVPRSGVGRKKAARWSGAILECRQDL